MVTLCGTRRKRIRRSATLKTLEEGAMKIPEGEQIIEAGPGLHLVQSRSTDGHREVGHDKGMWTCDCPYFASGHADCSHACAVSMMPKTREESGCAIWAEHAR